MCIRDRTPRTAAMEAATKREPSCEPAIPQCRQQSERLPSPSSPRAQPSQRRRSGRLPRPGVCSHGALLGAPADSGHANKLIGDTAAGSVRRSGRRLPRAREAEPLVIPVVRGAAALARHHAGAHGILGRADATEERALAGGHDAAQHVAAEMCIRDRSRTTAPQRRVRPLS